MPFESRSTIYWVVEVVSDNGTTIYKRKEVEESAADSFFRDTTVVFPTGYTITKYTVREYSQVEIEFVRSLTFSNV